jgi:hypothetical protein
VVVAAIGHADAARLLAATTAIRAIQLLTKLGTALSLKRRRPAPPAVRRQAQLLAYDFQAAALAIAIVMVAGLAEALKLIGQDQIAATIPYLAIGMPARYLRFTDIRTSSPFYRLASAISGLVMVLLGWALGWEAAMFGLAFGAREWISYVVLRLWPRTPLIPRATTDEPLRFGEVARDSVIVGRRLLTYRLSKTALTVFGPFGNIAARTGRGLKWHRKLEAYLPHHFGGFVLFCAVTVGSAVVTVMHSGEPAAMVFAAGMLQLGFAATNVVLLWRYLPERDGQPLHEDDDDDE